MKKLLTVLAALAAALVHGIASAQPVELRFAFPAPPTSYLLTSAFQPWAKEVESASNGTLTIRIVPGVTLATFDNVYDRVLKGIADIGFGLTAPIGGQFTKTSVAGLPFTFDTPHQSAPALWKLYENGLIADEFKDVKPLGLFTFGHANIHTLTVKVRSLADMKGLKIRSGGKLQGDIVAALGGAPVTLKIGRAHV